MQGMPTPPCDHVQAIVIDEEMPIRRINGGESRETSFSVSVQCCPDATN
jgi:hypothetical protein